MALVNGDISAGGNGHLEAGITLQGSLDDSIWHAAPFVTWSMIPAYPYGKTAAGRTYSSTGPTAYSNLCSSLKKYKGTWIN